MTRSHSTVHSNNRAIKGSDTALTYENRPDVSFGRLRNGLQNLDDERGPCHDRNDRFDRRASRLVAAHLSNAHDVILHVSTFEQIFRPLANALRSGAHGVGAAPGAEGDERIHVPFAIVSLATWKFEI
jgi:hypothetical protein